MTKFCYNPDNKKYLQGSAGHNIMLYNAGMQKDFDFFIRGIIDKGILYLRVYYPYNDIDSLTRDKLYQASYELLQSNIDAILALLKRDNINIKEIIFNVDRAILESKGLYQL